MTGDHIGFLWAALILYSGSLAFAIWRLAAGRAYRALPKFLILIPGLLFHTWYLWQRGLSEERCPVGSLFETLVFTSWCLVAIHVCVLTFAKINYLTVFYMPIVILIQSAALLFSNSQTSMASLTAIPFHAAIIMLGYAAFGLAAAVGAMYLIQESQLRRHRIGTRFMLLPPMLRLESVHRTLLLSGFAFLTVGLFSGFMGAQKLGQTFSHMDSKLVWSIMVWVLYLGVLLGKFLWRINNRWVAWASVFGCVFLLSTFWLANAFSSFHRY